MGGGGGANLRGGGWWGRRGRGVNSSLDGGLQALDGVVEVVLQQLTQLADPVLDNVRNEGWRNGRNWCRESGRRG